jgi:hypothetical protein
MIQYKDLLKCLDYVNIDEAKNSLNVNSEYFSYYKLCSFSAEILISFFIVYDFMLLLFYEFYLLIFFT